MYNLLVVDDEQWIRKGIIAKLGNNNISFNHIFEAEDGKDALRIMDEQDINIVITDIKMSTINGLEFIKKVKENREDIKFIIITGHAEFDYAKQALDMQVSGFLLKPVKDKELVEVVSIVMEELGESLQYDKESYMSEQKLNQCFHERQTMQCDLYDFSFYSLALFHIEDNHTVLALKSQIKSTLTSYELECNYKIINNYRNNRQVIVIFMSDNREKIYKNRNWFLFEVFYKIRDELRINITIGVSNIKGLLNRNLYVQAKDALHLKLLNGIGNIYYYREQKYDKSVFDEDIKLMEKYIQCKDIKSIKSLMDNMFDENNYTEDNIVSIKDLFYKVIRNLRYCFREMNYNNEILDVNYNEKEVFREFLDISSIKEYLVTNISDLLRKNSQPGDVKSIIKEAIKYVDSHYDEDLTVKDLSNRLGINSNYLSTLFKKETGKTYTQYLTELRIKNAMKLLMETDANVSQISKSVGYQDPQYFYRVFKKCTGKTPLSYRKLNIN